MLACNIINEMSWHCGKHTVATLNNFHLIENYANPYDIMQSLWLVMMTIISLEFRIQCNGLAGRITDKSHLQLT